MRTSDHDRDERPRTSTSAVDGGSGSEAASSVWRKPVTYVAVEPSSSPDLLFSVDQQDFQPPRGRLRGRLRSRLRRRTPRTRQARITASTMLRSVSLPARASFDKAKSDITSRSRSLDSRLGRLIDARRRSLSMLEKRPLDEHVYLQGAVDLPAVFRVSKSSVIARVEDDKTPPLLSERLSVAHVPYRSVNPIAGILSPVSKSIEAARTSQFENNVPIFTIADLLESIEKDEVSADFLTPVSDHTSLGVLKPPIKILLGRLERRLITEVYSKLQDLKISINTDAATDSFTTDESYKTRLFNNVGFITYQVQGGRISLVQSSELYGMQTSFHEFDLQHGECITLKIPPKVIDAQMLSFAKKFEGTRDVLFAHASFYYKYKVRRVREDIDIFCNKRQLFFWDGKRERRVSSVGQHAGKKISEQKSDDGSSLHYEIAPLMTSSSGAFVYYHYLSVDPVTVPIEFVEKADFTQLVNRFVSFVAGLNAYSKTILGDSVGRRYFKDLNQCLEIKYRLKAYQILIVRLLIQQIKNITSATSNFELMRIQDFLSELATTLIVTFYDHEFRDELSEIKKTINLGIKLVENILSAMQRSKLLRSGDLGESIILLSPHFEVDPKRCGYVEISIEEYCSQRKLIILPINQSNRSNAKCRSDRESRSDSEYSIESSDGAHSDSSWSDSWSGSTSMPKRDHSHDSLSISPRAHSLGSSRSSTPRLRAATPRPMLHRSNEFDESTPTDRSSSKAKGSKYDNADFSLAKLVGILLYDTTSSDEEDSMFHDSNDGDDDNPRRQYSRRRDSVHRHEILMHEYPRVELHCTESQHRLEASVIKRYSLAWDWYMQVRLAVYIQHPFDLEEDDNWFRNFSRGYHKASNSLVCSMKSLFHFTLRETSLNSDVEEILDFDLSHKLTELQVNEIELQLSQGGDTIRSLQKTYQIVNELFEQVTTAAMDDVQPSYHSIGSEQEYYDGDGDDDGFANSEVQQSPAIKQFQNMLNQLLVQIETLEQYSDWMHLMMACMLTQQSIVRSISQNVFAASLKVFSEPSLYSHCAIVEFKKVCAELLIDSNKMHHADSISVQMLEKFVMIKSYLRSLVATHERADVLFAEIQQVWDADNQAKRQREAQVNKAYLEYQRWKVVSQELSTYASRVMRAERARRREQAEESSELVAAQHLLRTKLDRTMRATRRALQLTYKAYLRAKSEWYERYPDASLDLQRVPLSAAVPTDADPDQADFSVNFGPIT